MNNKTSNITSIIFTCDNNADIYFIVKKTKDRLSNFSDVLVLSETKKVFDDNKNIILAGEGVSFKDKLQLAISKVNTDYVLIMLDDYYVFENNEDCFELYSELIKKLDFDCLKICKEYISRKRISKVNKDVSLIDSPFRYDINFHPTIWKKDTLIDCLKNCPSSDIRNIEPFFSKYLRENCKKVYTLCKCFLRYEELIVAGLFFRKPFRKYLKNIYSGNRKKCSFFFEIKYKFKKAISLRCPDRILKFLKHHVFKGKVYYSE